MIYFKAKQSKDTKNMMMAKGYSPQAITWILLLNETFSPNILRKKNNSMLKKIQALREKIEAGDGTQKDLDAMLQLCGFVKGTGYCTLVTGAAVLVQSALKLFRSEFEEHIVQKRCPFKAVPAGAGGRA